MGFVIKVTKQASYVGSITASSKDTSNWWLKYLNKKMSFTTILDIENKHTKKITAEYVKKHGAELKNGKY